MREFPSPEAFAAFLTRRVAEVARGFPAELAMVGSIIGVDAKARLGHYQGQDGPFPAWRQLSPFTQDRRVKLGFTPNDPLYMSGQLAESISMEPTPWVVAVGVRRGIPSLSSDATMGDIAMWQEFGAARLGLPWIPPRPFLGPALFANSLEALPLISEAVVERLTGFPTTPRRFSRLPIAVMGERVFAFGKTLTGGI